jgi:hypothetical protein
MDAGQLNSAKSKPGLASFPEPPKAPGDRFLVYLLNFIPKLDEHWLVSHKVATVSPS